MTVQNFSFMLLVLIEMSRLKFIVQVRYTFECSVGSSLILAVSLVY